MHHDSYSNTCPRDGFIMSPSRGTQGETVWSTCSAEVMGKLRSWAKCLLDKPGKVKPDMDHTKYKENPGQRWGAKAQCQLLLRDPDAVLHNTDLKDVCQSLECSTPHRAGYYFAGPALEGTTCLDNKWCQGGKCVTKNVKPQKVVKGGWSEWKSEQCTSGCTVKSKGFQARRRSCTNPKPENTEEGCEGASYDITLCKDEKVCKKTKRKTVVQYATEKCVEFSKLLPIFDSQTSGLQAPHEESRQWMACSIFCRRKDDGSFYTPRLDLNDVADPYFPDGTRCHNSGKTTYYCLQHHCVPENQRLSKSLLWNEDVPLSQNARPKDTPMPKTLMEYLSLDKEGHPLLKTLGSDTSLHPPEELWDTKDYLEIPH